MDNALIFAFAGLCAGLMNALAGGGSFVTLPVLIAAGIPSVSANATSTVAVWPGSVMSVAVYRRELRAVGGVPLRAMLWVTLIGGAIGAGLLLATPVRLFDRLLPWLMLVATLALSFAPQIRAWAAKRASVGRTPLMAGQLLLGIYAGYYGGGAGLMMLALWSLIDGADIKALAGPRIAIVAAANAIAILCFAFAGVVHWLAALLMGAGSIAGGYAGAHICQRLPPTIVRILTLALCVSITLVFFVRAYR